MTENKKIEEILGIVREERKLSNDRFVQVSTGLHEVRSELQEEHKLNNDWFVQVSTGLHEVRSELQEERKLNNDRFVQVSTGLHEVRNELQEVKVELKGEINKVYSTLFQDLQVLNDDLVDHRRRIGRLEKKLA